MRTGSSATAVVHRVVRAQPQDVAAILADGWLYGAWIAASTGVRAVSSDWPAPGASLAQGMGAWPLAVSSVLTVVHHDPGRLLVVDSTAGSLVSTRIQIEVAGTDEQTSVTMGERFTRPASDRLSHAGAGLLRLHNSVSLRRLALLAERPTSYRG
jgi:hypothetical protein